MCVPTPQRACDTLRLGLALLVDVDVGNHCIDDRQRVQQLPLLPSQEVRMVRKLDALSSEKRRGAREKSEIDPLRRVNIALVGANGKYPFISWGIAKVRRFSWGIRKCRSL